MPGGIVSRFKISTAPSENAAIIKIIDDVIASILFCDPPNRYYASDCADMFDAVIAISCKNDRAACKRV